MTITRFRKCLILARSAELTACKLYLPHPRCSYGDGRLREDWPADTPPPSLTIPRSYMQTDSSANYRLRQAPTGNPEDRSRFHQHSPAMEQSLSYILDSTLETVDRAEENATRIATELGFAEDEVMQISMAVREGAVNAVLHGNAYAPDKKVTLAFEHTPEELVITIRDQGKGIDLGTIPNPLAPENLLKTSGRGIFLMRSFMDVVEIRPSQTGTEIKLIKHVRGPSAGGKEGSQ